MRYDAKLVPVLALGCGALGFFLSSTLLIVAAILLAGYFVVRGVATIGGGDMWRTSRRRRHR